MFLRVYVLFYIRLHGCETWAVGMGEKKEIKGLRKCCAIEICLWWLSRQKKWQTRKYCTFSLYQITVIFHLFILLLIVTATTSGRLYIIILTVIGCFLRSFFFFFFRGWRNVLKLASQILPNFFFYIDDGYVLRKYNTIGLIIRTLYIAVVNIIIIIFKVNSFEYFMIFSFVFKYFSFIFFKNYKTFFCHASLVV